MTQRGRARIATLALLTLSGACLAAFAIFVGADFRRALATLAGLGPWLLVAIAPFVLARFVDSLGVRALLVARHVSSPSLARIFETQFALESLAIAMPAGGVAADVATAPAYASAGVEIADGVSIAAGRKWSMMRAQAWYLLLAATATLFVVREASGARTSLVVAAVLAWLAGVAITLILRRGTPARRLLGIAARFRFLRAWAHAREGAFDRVDRGLESLTALPRRKRIGLEAIYFAFWLVDALETLVIARLAGIHLDIAQALVVDAALSAVRALAFVAPSGLGAVELATLGLFTSLGVRDVTASAAAFSVLRRAKEIVCVLIGYSMLAVITRPAKLARPA